MTFCSECGAKTVFVIPQDDTRCRDVCTQCQTIHYKNPNIVVGTIPVYQDKVLLCKRSIEPRKDLWTLPGGFMEMGETLEQAAVRESVEEANANLVLTRLFSIYSIPNAGQVHMYYLAALQSLDFSPGHETSDTALFSIRDIDFDTLSFASVKFTIEKLQLHVDRPTDEVYHSFRE